MIRKKIGILGGGQLGKMLLLEANKFALDTYVLEADENSVCKGLTNNFIAGDIKNYYQVLDFGLKVDTITVEIENVSVEALEKLEEEGKEVIPSSYVIKILKNKAAQKLFYKQEGIPTAKYEHFENLEELLKMFRRYKKAFIWKSAEGGYDGKGVKLIENEEDLSSLPNGVCIAEKLIDIDKEFSIIVCRDWREDIKVFPAFEMIFNNSANLVEYVICPSSIDKQKLKEAEKIAVDIVRKLKSSGTFAVEFFLTKQGEILVNETAPRVHNSGHLTIEACYTSQFEQHIRCLCGFPLGSTELKTPAAVMLNICGEDGFKGSPEYLNIEEAMEIEGLTPHIYGKKQTKAFRKMGHLTIVDTTIQKAFQKAEAAKKIVKVISYE